MKCPYCTEEINTQAVVCRYCGHDLSFFSPVHKEVGILEKHISEALTSIENLQSDFNKLQGKQKDYFLVLRIVLIIILPILISLGSYFIFTRPYINYLRLLVWISILCAFPFGIWLGLTWRKSHLKEYIIFGLIIGIVSQIGILFIRNSYSHPGDPLFPLPLGWGRQFILNLLMVFFLFVLGSLVGDWMEWKKSGAKPRSILSQKFAASIVQFTSKGSSEDRKALAIKKWSVILDIFIKGILPLAFAIATIIENLKSLSGIS